MLSPTWSQTYDPLHNAVLSTAVAALPVVVLLTSIAWLRIRIHIAAVAGLAVALLVAVFVYGMPIEPALAASVFGGIYGLFPIGWIILNLIFLYQLTVEKGLFAVLRNSLGTLAPDSRIQLILIAFSFGAFFEGAAGFGTPVAVTAAILIELGFKPLEASALSLIANTAPVAFGALGTPIIALSSVTGLDIHELSAMIGRQLPFFSLLVPFWVVWAFAGFRGVLEVWPAALTAGLTFAIPQYFVSNYFGPWLVDVTSAVASIGALVLLLKFWQPKNLWKSETRRNASLPPTKVREQREDAQIAVPPTKAQLWQAWLPWILLTVFVFLWGLPPIKNALNGLSNPQVKISHLHGVVIRVPPVAPKQNPAESAIYQFSWLSATGSGILVAAVISGLVMRYGPGQLLRRYGATLIRVRYSLLTIAAMLALGYVTRYSGTDATLGLAMAKTGWLYPFFGTLLGWLGVALTGSDTASNVLFGSLQTITAAQTGISPTLMAAANSSGGVMGKMVDAQSIVVASTATNWYGHEGSILRYVFFHSLALASLVGLLVFLQAKVAPFTFLVR